MDEVRKQKALKLLSKPPTLAADGNAISISDQGFADITFIQVVSETEENLTVQGVASVRTSFSQLKEFVVSLNNAIKAHEEKLKKIQSNEKKKTTTKR